MLKNKLVKSLLVFLCIVTIVMPYMSTSIAAVLTHETTSANLQNARVREGGKEESGTLTEAQSEYYDESMYNYKVGDVTVYKILDAESGYDNELYCLNEKESFPSYINTLYYNIADLKDSTDSNVKLLHLSTSYAANNELWSSNYKSLMWLINNIYLSKQAPEQKDEFLTKVFGEENLEVVKALFTDDDIDVVQQYAIWYFTNRDSEEFNVTTLPAVRLQKYEIDIEQEQYITSEWGAYDDFTPSSFPEEISYAKRQEYANTLYNYLITNATSAEEDEEVTYPEIDFDFINQNGTTVTTEDYFITGPFKIKSGTADASKYQIKLLDQNDEEISSSDYKIKIEGETDFTNQEINEIFDKSFYIYLSTDNEVITKYKLNLTYSEYETEASLWETTEKTISDGDFQPVALITRKNTPHSQTVNVNIERKEADLALRKYIIKVNDTALNRAPSVNTEKLKNETANTAEYIQKKSPVEAYAGDTVVYEIRVYNEGEIATKVPKIADSLPVGLELAENSSINNVYGWKKVSKSSENNSKTYETEYLKNTELPAFNKETGEISSAYVQIECKISNSVLATSVLTNVAEIYQDEIKDRDSAPNNNTYVTNDLDSKNYIGDKDNDTDLTKDNYFYKGIEDDDDFEKVVIKGKSFDLSLKKFITKINGNAPATSRVPNVDVSKLKAGTATNATYETVKTPLVVSKGDVVVYTIRVYNEGEMSGYAEEIADYLPEGLGFLVGHEVNVDNYWSISANSDTVKLSTISGAKANLTLEEFSGVTTLDDVDVVVGKCKITSSKLKSSDVDTKNLIKGFDKDTDTELSYKDIQVACVVLVDKAEGDNLKNIAEVSKDLDENKNEVTDIDSVPGSVIQDNYTDEEKNEDDNDTEELTTEDPKIFDLSLQKFITKINNVAVTDRNPVISKTESGKLQYTHTEDPASVCYNDYVTFTIRVYNEGDLAGYAKEIVDYLPTSGLEFASDNVTNIKYGWVLYDANGNETDKLSQAVTARTTYLSKSASAERGEDALIKAYDGNSNISSSNPDYKDVQIVFKVTAVSSAELAKTERQYINYAEIYDDEDENGNDIEDKDSTPNNKKELEDDIDSDKIYVKYFDLKLEKKLIKILITEDGVTKIVNLTGNETLPKVEIHRKKVDKTTVKFVYQITVTNEGQIDGYAKEIKDYIPDGLEFVEADNKQWSKASTNVITTNALSATKLSPGESASVQVTLKWVNSESNLGIKTNVAEISADKNDSDTPDIDSTPDNKKSGEDDIDSADVVLSISTGIFMPQNLWLAVVVILIWIVGIVLIKKFVI